MPKRKLTKEEIDDILSFITPNSYIPKEIAISHAEKIKKDLTEQLEQEEVYTEHISELKQSIEHHYKTTLLQPGELVGILMAQSIGEQQTQANLNNFHKAGSADKQPVVSKFSELVNVTSDPKNPSFFIYFNSNNDTVEKTREMIGHSIVQLTVKKITSEFIIHTEKEEEKWYDIHNMLYGREKPEEFKSCITLKLNNDILYEYKLPLEKISENIEKEYSDVFCVWSPDCFAQIDVYIDTKDVDLQEEQLAYVTQENYIEIYLEEVVKPILENITVAGIQGILDCYYLKSDNEWIVETENMKEKHIKKIRGQKKAKKSVDIFQQILAHPAVDFTRTISNNVWDIYNTLDIEATRQYMIEQFSEVMKGINICHISLLVDKMTFNGIMQSISRYTMRQASNVLARCSFEEALDNLLTAAVYTQQDNTKGLSSSIICGKRSYIGTGLCGVEMDLRKLGIK